MNQWKTKLQGSELVLIAMEILWPAGPSGFICIRMTKILSLQRESGLQRKSNIEIKINGRKINETRRELQVLPTETTSPRWRTLVSRPEFSPTLFFFSTATEQKSKHSSENKWLSLPPHPPSHPPPLPPPLPPHPPLDKEETEKRGEKVTGIVCQESFEKSEKVLKGTQLERMMWRARKLRAGAFFWRGRVFVSIDT